MKDLERLIDAEDKKVHEAQGILAKFYRIILKDMNINLMQYNRLLLRWLDDPRNNIPKDGRTRSFRRGNLVKAITTTETHMSIKTFLKGIIIFNPVYIKLDLELGFARGKRTNHSIRVNLTEDDLREIAGTDD